MKIAVIGAGSRGFGAEMVRDPLVCEELSGCGVAVVLVDATGIPCGSGTSGNRWRMAATTARGSTVFQALLLDPVVDSVTAAAKLLDEALYLQGEFVPEFA